MSKTNYRSMQSLTDDELQRFFGSGMQAVHREESRRFGILFDVTVAGLPASGAIGVVLLAVGLGTLPLKIMSLVWTVTVLATIVVTTVQSLRQLDPEVAAFWGVKRDSVKLALATAIIYGIISAAAWVWL